MQEKAKARKPRHNKEGDPFIGITNVHTRFSIKKGEGYDIPYLSMNFNDNGRHYKINQRGHPLPSLFTALKESESIVQKAQSIKTPTQAAVFVLEQFGFAANKLGSEGKYAFKVIISKDTTTEIDDEDVIIVEDIN